MFINKLHFFLNFLFEIMFISNKDLIFGMREYWTRAVVVCVLCGVILAFYRIKSAFRAHFHLLYPWFCAFLETLGEPLRASALNSQIPSHRISMWNERLWIMNLPECLETLPQRLDFTPDTGKKCGSWPYSSTIHFIFTLWNIPALPVNCVVFNSSCM